MLNQYDTAIQEENKYALISFLRFIANCCGQVFFDINNPAIHNYSDL